MHRTTGTHTFDVRTHKDKRERHARAHEEEGKGGNNHGATLTGSLSPYDGGA